MAYQPQSGSVVAFQGNPSVLQVLATVTNPVTVSSVSGTVGASVIGTVPITQSGTFVTSIVSTVPSSVLVGASIFGQLPGGTAVLGSVAALQGTNPWNIAGSVAAVQTGTWSTSVMTNVITSIATAGQVMGSVATLQGTNPWITRFANSSIIAINAGSVVALSQGSVISLIQGSVAAAQRGAWAVSVLSQTSGTSSTYAVRTSITAVSIMSANANRRGGTIYNNSSTAAFVQLGTVVTTSMYTVKMVDQSYYELPFGWTGVVGGITASNAGVWTVTEFT